MKTILRAPTLPFHLCTISTLYRPALLFQLHTMSPLHQNADKVTSTSALSSAVVDLPEDQHYTTIEENNDYNYINADDISQSLYIKRITQASNDDDVFWSMASNTFFIGGGLFYMIGSCWDLSLSNSGADPQNMLLYYSVWILGPLVYLLNSIIDVTWAIRTMVADKKRRGELHVGESRDYPMTLFFFNLTYVILHMLHNNVVSCSNYQASSDSSSQHINMLPMLETRGIQAEM